MNRLFAKSLVMVGLVLITYLILWAVPAKSHVVYASILDKHERLDSIAGERLIFTGGSGIALGLDSEMIEDELGMPVVNMGVNAGFGLRYMLDEIRPSLREGDVVVIVPEYEYFYGTSLEGSQNLLWAYQIWGKELLGRFVPSTGQIRNVVQELPFFMQSRFLEILSTGQDPIYNRWAFSERGDFVNHLDFPAQEIWPSSVTQNLAFNPESLTLLDAFNAAADAKGASVFVLPPAVIESFYDYEDNSMQIDLITELIGSKTNVPLLAGPSRYVLPPEMFFDTVYHLNRLGRQARSEMVVEDLARGIATVGK